MCLPGSIQGIETKQKDDNKWMKRENEYQNANWGLIHQWGRNKQTNKLEKSALFNLKVLCSKHWLLPSISRRGFGINYSWKSGEVENKIVSTSLNHFFHQLLLQLLLIIIAIIIPPFFLSFYFVFFKNKIFEHKIANRSGIKSDFCLSCISFYLYFLLYYY